MMCVPYIRQARYTEATQIPIFIFIDIFEICHHVGKLSSWTWMTCVSKAIGDDGGGGGGGEW